MMRWLLAVWALVIALGSVPSATGAVEGSCQVFVNGVDLASEERPLVRPDATGTLSYRVTSTQDVRHWSVTLHFGPMERVVLEETLPRGIRDRSGNMSVAGYAEYGTGKYEVTGTATLADGTSCLATMGVLVEGSIFDSAIGIAAVAVVGLAGAGIVLTVSQMVLDAKDVVDAAKDFVEQARHLKKAASPTPPSP
jgi:hypothetical protein